MLPLWLVWAAMISTSFILGVMALLVAPPASNVVPADPAGLIIAFGFFSAVLLAISATIRKKYYNDGVIQEALKAYRAENKTDSTDAQKDAKGLASTPLEAAVGKKIFVPLALSWALCEAVAIHGFALSQQLKMKWVYLPFGLPAFLMLVLFKPSVRHIQSLITRFEAENS